MTILPYKNILPKLAQDVFLATGACVIGDVHLGEGSSVWFNAVIRGDINHIRIGCRTNIQDLSMVHVDSRRFPTIIGDEVTIGHSAVIHACTIGDLCLIGMGSIVMDGAVIGRESLVAAGSVVTEGTEIPSGVLVKGIPGKVARPLRDEERAWLKQSAQNYFELAERYRTAI